MSLATMVVDLLLKTDQFESGAKHASGLTGMLESKFESLEHTLMHFGQAFAAAFAVHQIEETIESMAKLVATAERLGVSTEKMGGLQFAAKETHVETEKLTKGMSILNVTLGQSIQGNEKAIAKFDRLGLSFHELANIPADEALERIADRINTFHTAAEKSAAAADLFGKKVGPDLLPLLELGSAGIEKLEDKAKDLGKTFNDEAAEKIKAAHEAIVEMTSSVQGLPQELAVTLAPGIKEIVTDLTDLITKFREASGLKLNQEHLSDISRQVNSMSEDQFKDFQHKFGAAQGRGGLGGRFATGNLINNTFGHDGKQFSIDDSEEVQEALSKRMDKIFKGLAAKEEAQARQSRELQKPAGALYNDVVKKPSEALANLITSAIGVEITKKVGKGKGEHEKVTGIGGLAGGLNKLDAFMDKARGLAIETSLGQGPLAEAKAKADRENEKATDEWLRKAEANQRADDRAGRGKFSSNFASDHEFKGNTALERGTAAAFSQSRRSQGQNQLVDLAAKQLAEAEKQTKLLAGQFGGGQQAPVETLSAL